MKHSRPTRIFGIILLVGLIGWPVVANDAQPSVLDAKWEKLVESALTAERGQDGAVALDRWQAAFGYAKSKNYEDYLEIATGKLSALYDDLSRGEPDTRTIDALVGYLTQQERRSEAVEWLHRAIALKERESDRDVLFLAADHRLLAMHYQELQLPDLAERAMRQSLALREEHYGLVHLRLVDNLRQLANFLGEEGRYIEAAEPLRRATSIAERSWGVDSTRAADLRRSLVALEQLLAGEGDAELDGYRVAPEAAAGCGCRCSSFPELDELLDRGESSQAIALAEQYVAETEVEYGSMSLELATALEAIASVHEKLDPSINLAALERRLKILRHHLGDADPRIADAALDLAHIYRTRNDTPRAAVAYQLRVESLEAGGRFTADLATALTDLAHMQMDLSDVVAAVETYELGVKLWHDIAGPLAPETINVRRDWAKALVELEDFTRAEEGLLELARELEQSSRSRHHAYQLKRTQDELQRLYALARPATEAWNIDSGRR